MTETWAPSNQSQNEPNTWAIKYLSVKKGIEEEENEDMSEKKINPEMNA